MLSEKATNISPAATIEISARIAELRRQGTNIISLNIGEPDYPTPENISQAAKSAIDAHFTKYQPVPGILELREAICKKFKTDNGLTYQPNEICVSAGAKQAVFNAVFVLCGEGDEVIIPTPCWVSYSEIVKLVGATPVYVPCAPEENFDLNLTGIRSAISSRTKAILINTPNNPSGAAYSAETLTGLADRLRAASAKYGHRIFLISDEPYREIMFGGQPIQYAAKFYDDTLTCYSFSKSLSLPGERIGYVAANPRCEDAEYIVPMCGQISRGTGHNCPASLIQLAVAECLDETSDLGVYETNMELIYAELKKLDFTVVKPSGTFYIFPKALEEDANAFCKKAMKYDLALVPGDSFGCPGYFRMAYCIDTEKVRRSFAALEKFVAEEYGK